MVKLNSNSRFFNINQKIILTQADTTVGFLSQNKQKLQKIKSRDKTKPFLKIYANFKELKKNIRIPTSKKNLIRRSKKTTFIIKNQAFRVAPHKLNSAILKKFTWGYSTSANESGKNFDRSFCTNKSDVIIEDKNLLFEGKASKLYKINHKNIKRLR